MARVGEQDTALGAQTDAAAAGLSASLLATPDAERASFVARLRSLPQDRAVKLARQDVVWDGKDFKVTVKHAELGPRETEAAL